MPKHKEWRKEERQKENVPPKERSEIIAEEEKGINSELLRQSFKYQSPSYMYENLNNTIIRERNKIEIDSIKSLTELRKIESKICLRKKKGLKSQIKQQILLKRFLALIKVIKKDKDLK